MAASNLNLGKASGGVLNVQPADGTTNTSLVLPASGVVVATDVAVTDNAIARYDGVTGKVQNSSVVIDDNGNVGINDSAPQYKLSIGQSISLPSTAGSKITAFSKYTHVGNASFLQFDTVRTSAGSTHYSSEERIRKIIDATEMGYIGFGDNTVKLGNSSGDKVIIDVNGNVGIGTSVLNNKLEVNGSIGFGSTTGNGRIYTDANWGCLLQSDVSSPAVAEFGFLNNAGTHLALIDTAGNLLLKSGNGGLGYGTGAGGTVTQLTSKSTAVALNKPTGRITMNNAALAAGASVDFLLYNSIIGTYDQLITNLVDGSVPDPRVYKIRASGVGSGYTWIRVTNESAGSLSEALQFTFSITKGATA